MTWRRYTAIQHAWERSPRPEKFLAAYFEYKAPEAKKARPIEDLIAMFGLGSGGGSKTLGG